MQIQFTGDGKGFSLSLKATWRSLGALIGAIALIGSTPGIIRLGSFLGWW